MRPSRGASIRRAGDPPSLDGVRGLAMLSGSAMGAEAERLAGAAARDGLGLRLMGGVAVWLVAPSVRFAPFARDYADLDLAVRKRDSRKVTPFMEREGYVP